MNGVNIVFLPMHSLGLAGLPRHLCDPHPDGLPFIIAGRGGGSINTGRFLSDVKGNQGDLLTTLLSCAGVPVDRPIGIATKQIKEIIANA